MRVLRVPTFNEELIGVEPYAESHCTGDGRSGAIACAALAGIDTTKSQQIGRQVPQLLIRLELTTNGRAKTRTSDLSLISDSRARAYSSFTA